ncbi:MAG TPA: hypothetical protein VL325_03920 [Pyrinomonadaceae bacterium]|jgi:hypothetical protein|nr:hypothetical protein [Pyrinomonadaceae bacterium]
MRFSKTTLFIILAAIVFSVACQKNILQPQLSAPTSMKDVPAVRLNYRYEPDVPAPSENARPADERNASVQNDFDQHRPQELLDRTITSPDKQHVLAVYHRTGDVLSEFRLDMYSPDGKLLRKVTPDAMAVHFTDAIVWAPDSSAVAFVAMVRVPQIGGENQSPAATAPTPPAPESSPDANAATVPENTEATTPTGPTPAAPVGVLLFRTEQLYICNADGDGTKPLTQNEGLIYFYYAWSPDSSMLAALAVTAREWQFLNAQADTKGELFIPTGRPRVIEKNGRERRLDDGLTQVHPVWSPDSAKVAGAFGTQVRIYDATGNNPTQAAIPLQNQLLLSSQAYDREEQQKLQAANSNAVANAPANTTATNTAAVNSPSNQPQGTLPDPSTLVSFNPIVDLVWNADDLIYFQTAFVKKMKNDADSVTSFARWHRLVLSVQPGTQTAQ